MIVAFGAGETGTHEDLRGHLGEFLGVFGRAKVVGRRDLGSISEGRQNRSGDPIETEVFSISVADPVEEEFGAITGQVSWVDAHEVSALEGPEVGMSIGLEESLDQSFAFIRCLIL